jgi:hypothetical protein
MRNEQEDAAEIRKAEEAVAKNAAAIGLRL